MSPGPSRIGELVRLIQTGNDQQQSAAIEELLPVIIRQAKRIRVGSGAWEADDLVDEAPSVIWQLLRDGKYASDQNFGGWCSTVLKNEFLRRIRDGQTRKRYETQSPTATHESDTAESVARAIASKRQFSAEDLAILETWPVKRRVLTMALSGLWLKIESQELWRRWVEEAGFDHPFPPRGFIHALDRTQRLSELAEATGYTPNAISSVKYRYLKQLSRLPYIQELNRDR